jgi:hypothetical protein
MTGPRIPVLPVYVRAPLSVMRRVGDLAYMIARRSNGDTAIYICAKDIENLVDEYVSHDAAQLAEIAERGT